MLQCAFDGLRRLQRGVFVIGLLAVGAADASAQMVFDGNLVFNNNATGTFAGQFAGGATSAGPTCAAGLTATTLATTTYTHNAYGDPLLPNAIFQTNVVPSWKPAAGSPAWTTSVQLPNDGFFEPTCYAGAIGPNSGDDWTQGWTYYDSTGAGRTDLHLTGMPDPRPVAIYHSINLYSSRTWGPDSNYEIRGLVRVKSQATLTIAAGTVVLGDRATIGTLIIERGADIQAVGTAANPIIMTTNDTPGTMARGGWGGLVIHGYAKANAANTCLGDSVPSEGGDVGYYGGNDDNDGSGELKYVRVEYAGKQISANNELNSFTFNALGRNTKLSYLQAHRGADDGFEFFGGVADLKRGIATDGTDDGYDTQMGTRGRAQFVIVRCSPEKAPESTPTSPQNGDKGIEADNNEFDHNQTQCSGYSHPIVANFTFIGDKRSGPNFPGPSSAVNYRRGTAYEVMNSICYNFKTAALRIDDNNTWEHHCAALPTAPSPCVNVGVPISAGRAFITFGAPNPFRNHVSFNFALPQEGPVRVEIFSPAGQRVATLSPGTMPAGPQTLRWDVDRTTPAGVYFYKVFAAGAASSGKVVRVD